jgi:hypothetical protein
LFAANIFEALGTKVLNPLSVELNCQSKVRTLLAFAQGGIQIPKTVYIPSNVIERMDGGGMHDYSGVVSRLVTQGLSSKRIVLKPDAGTHGKGVDLVDNLNHLRKMIESITPSIINPVGIVAQEFIPKWFYDLRILVSKEKGKAPYCYETALARGGFKEFRTNTWLGNMVFRAKLPASIRHEACKCSEILGGNSESWVIALDAMPWIGENLRDKEEELRKHFFILEQDFSEVKKVKKNPAKKQNFSTYTKEITEAYSNYMASDSYAFIEDTVNETLDKAQNSVYFHEGNACPEFWEQTRVVGGANLAEDFLKCALSLLDL